MVLDTRANSYFQPWSCFRFFCRVFFLTPPIIASLFLGVVAGAGCQKTRAPAPPHVVLLTVDALRSDHLSVMGYSRQTTPFLDSLCRKGILFQSVIAQSSYTKTSMASLLTGLDPNTVGAFLADDVLPEGVTTLAETLKKRGYRTGCAQANPSLEAKFGFGQGFDWYADLFPEDTMQKQEKISYRADRMNARALEWLAQAPSSQPVFLYLHYMETHHPYLPPAPYDTLYDPHFDHALPDFTLVYRLVYGPGKVPMPAELEKIYQERYTADLLLQHLIALYDGELHYLDNQLEIFVNRVLAQLGPNTVVILCADHGEEFLEHGQFEHGKSLYQEVLGVPLLIYSPGRITQAAAIPDLIRNLDVFPTVLDLAGIPVPDYLPGQSLRPLWEGKAGKAPEAAFSRLYSPGQAVWGGAVWGDGILRDLAAITTPRWRLIVDLSTGQEQLFDHQSDPGDRRDVSPGRAEEIRGLRQKLNQSFQDSQALKQTLGLSPPGKTAIDPETQKRLEALGYLKR